MLIQLVFLCDIWIIYAEKIEANELAPNVIITGLRKVSHDNKKSVQITAFTQLFRLLEAFAPIKNACAPAVYKALIICVIEHFTTPDVREYLLANFKSILSLQDTIPIDPLIEPIIKQLQTIDASKVGLNIFDLDFLLSAAENPKLSLKNAVQLMDVFARMYLNDLIFAHLSIQGLIQILSANLEAEPVQEYTIKFVKIALALLFSSEKSKLSKSTAPTRSPYKQTGTKAAKVHDDDTLNAQKRALIIQIIKEIITFGNSRINAEVKTLLLHTYHQLSKELGIEHRGVLALLSLYGEARKIISEFQLELEKEKIEPEKKELEALAQQKEAEKQSRNSLLMLNVSPNMRQAKQSKSKPSLLESIFSNAKADPKVVKEIEVIRKNLTEKTLKMKEIEAKEKAKQELQKKALKDIIDKRMIEHGVALMNKKGVSAPEMIIFPEGVVEQEKINETHHRLPEIKLVHLENEEERDRYGVNVLIIKYSKALKSLFNCYANSGHSDKANSSFETLQRKLQLISLPEVWKLIKDHDLASLITQEELKVLMRLTNTDLLKVDSLKCLSFEGFKTFVIQLAIFLYSRPPQDLSHLPIFCAVDELMRKLRNEQAKQGKNTVYFDDPDATEPGDPEMNKHLNQLLKQNPEHAIPEVI